jgi:hypothetical protein
MPIFVLTHRPPEIPPKQDDRLTFTFLSGDLASAVEQAKTAAGLEAVQAKISVQEVGARTSLRFRIRSG